MRPFGKGCLEVAPFNGWFHAVNIAALDGIDGAALAAVPVQYEDGRAGCCDAAPASTSHL